MKSRQEIYADLNQMIDNPNEASPHDHKDAIQVLRNSETWKAMVLCELNRIGNLLTRNNEIIEEPVSLPPLVKKATQLYLKIHEKFQNQEDLKDGSN